MDEAHRFINFHDRQDPIMEFLDIARNRGISFILADKKPNRLPPLATDLADTLIFRPARSPAFKSWLRGAGADPDLPELPPVDGPGRPWFIMPDGGDVSVTTMGSVVASFGSHLPQSQLVDIV